MNKIATGVLGLATVVSLVGGSAFAVFTAQADVHGLAINSGSAGLEVGIGEDAPFNSLDLTAGGHLDNAVPGMSVDLTTAANPLYLYNTSTGGFDLSVVAKVTDSWTTTNSANSADLANNVVITVQEVAGGVLTGSPVSLTLMQLHDSGMTMPGPVIPAGTSPANRQGYAVNLSVNSSADNTIADADLSNITVQFTGTQVIPGP